MFSRYLFILLFGIGGLFLVYKIVTPVTIFLLEKSMFLFGSYSAGSVLYFTNFNVLLVPACFAGSAFFLLILLVFSTANISPKKRIFALLTSTVILLVLNYLRIIFMILIANQVYFETVHWVFWNIMSVFFVVVIWFFTARMYNIKEIPVYSDLKYLAGLSKKKNHKVIRGRVHKRKR